MTVLGDLYSLGERSRAQGLIVIVWAVSAVIGPLASGHHHRSFFLGLDILDQPTPPGRRDCRLFALSTREAGAWTGQDRLHRRNPILWCHNFAPAHPDSVRSVGLDPRMADGPIRRDQRAVHPSREAR
jgi:hypothetical protein